MFFPGFPIQYDGRVFRPPSEGQSLLLQVTIGCSNNLCTYCDMYRDKKYRVRPLEDILGEIERVAEYFSKLPMRPQKVFLCDGDALAAPMDILLPVIQAVNAAFPNLKRISVYATAQNMLDKTQEELRILKENKLSLLYLGMESGSDRVLHKIVKHNTRADMIEGCHKAHQAGMQISIMGMLGVGGSELSAEHIQETASAISEINPEFFSFLTTFAIPGTPYHRMIEKKLLSPLTSYELLEEMYGILAQIRPEKEITFRANHVSNQNPLAGILPSETTSLLDIISDWMKETPKGVFPPPPTSM